MPSGDSGTLPDALSFLSPPPPPPGITGSYSVSESHYFTPIHLHSDLVWTVEAPAKDALQQRKKKEQWVSLEFCRPPGGLAEV